MILREKKWGEKKICTLGKNLSEREGIRGRVGACVRVCERDTYSPNYWDTHTFLTQLKEAANPGELFFFAVI